MNFDNSLPEDVFNRQPFFMPYTGIRVTAFALTRKAQMSRREAHHHKVPDD